MASNECRIMIETTNICNAKCSFCPNATLKRKKMLMSDEVFDKILTRVREENLNVSKFIFHLNGEPLVDPKIFSRVKTVKEQFPNAITRFTSNFSLASDDII